MNKYINSIYRTPTNIPIWFRKFFKEIIYNKWINCSDAIVKKQLLICTYNIINAYCDCLCILTFLNNTWLSFTDTYFIYIYIYLYKSEFASQFWYRMKSMEFRIKSDRIVRFINEAPVSMHSKGFAGVNSSRWMSQKANSKENILYICIKTMELFRWYYFHNN